MAEQSYNNSLPPTEYQLGIENRNFLSPVGFRVIIDKLRGVDFFCQSANIPAVAMEAPIQGTRFNKIPQPGDELQYSDLNIRFLIDENMKNWYQVHDWMREITTPYSSKEFTYKRGTVSSQNKNTVDIQTDLSAYDNQWKSDVSLFVLSSNYQPVGEFVFRNAFPVSLSTLVFNAADENIQYFTAECQLRYSHYDHFIYEAANATDASMQVDYRRSQEGVILPLG